jgi:hypothetical protein
MNTHTESGLLSCRQKLTGSGTASCHSETEFNTWCSADIIQQQKLGHHVFPLKVFAKSSATLTQKILYSA